MYFQSPMRSTTNSSKLTQALNSATPVTTLSSSGSCPKDKRVMTHLANQPPVAQSGYRYFGTGYSLRLKVHFKSRGLLLVGLTGASSTLIAGHWPHLPGGEEPVIAGRDPASKQQIRARSRRCRTTCKRKRAL